MKFSQYLQSKNIAEKTINSYQSEINRYTQFIGQQGRETTNTTKKDLLNYLQQADEKRHISTTYKKKIVGVLRQYYSYLNQEYEIENIANLIKIRGGKRRQIRELLTTEELETLCDAFYYEHQNQTKNYLLLSFASFQALTVAEINRIQHSDIDLRKGTIKIESTQRINSRTLSLNPSQISSLFQYLEDNESFKTASSSYNKLFNSIRKLNPKFEDFTQIRSSVITTWIKNHGLRKAQYLAGHKYISSTENYLAGEFESLQKDMELFHPLEKV